jgi:sulfate transport system permease protein
MAAILSRVRHDTYPKTDSAITEPRFVRWLLILVAVLFLGLFLFMPLLAVFVEAFKQGTKLYFATFEDQYALDAIFLTLKIAAISVPMNLVFGLAAAWAITKYSYRG